MGSGASTPGQKAQEVVVDASGQPKQPVRIPKIEERGITLQQLRDVWDQVQQRCKRWPDTAGGASSSIGIAPHTAAKVDMYAVCTYYVKPRACWRSCSYVELVAEGPQKPEWCVSHWFGQSMQSFVACLDEHARLRHLPHATYWICAFARDHNLLRKGAPAELSVADPFHRALALARGTISLLDRAGNCFSRTWCIYEAAITAEASSMAESRGDACELKLMDFATISSEGAAIVLSDGLTAEDEDRGQESSWFASGGPFGHKAWRESKFSVTLLTKGLRARIQDGQASSQSERVRLLNEIAGQANSRGAPLADHTNYDRVNAVWRWRFGLSGYAIAAGRQALDHAGLDGFEEPANLSVGNTYRSMATAFRAEKKYDLAWFFQEKHLQVVQSQHGGDVERLGDAHLGLAAIADGRGSWEQALELTKEAVDTLRRGLGPEHPLVADAYSQAAHMLLNQGDNDQALQFHEMALDIRIRALGDGHLVVGRSYTDLAQAERSRGEHTKALQFYEQALKIFTEVLGADHPTVGQIYLGIANIHTATGDFGTPVELYDRALGTWLVSERCTEDLSSRSTCSPQDEQPAPVSDGDMQEDTEESAT